MLIADAGLVAVGGSVDVSISASSEREQARVQTAYQQVVDALEERQEGRAVRLIADARESFVWRDDLHKKLDLLELQLQVEVQAALDQIDAVQADLEAVKAQYDEVVTRITEKFDDRREKLARGDEQAPGVRKMATVFVAL